MLGQIAEDAHDCNTTDGRPAIRSAAEARVARMLCADLECSTPDERIQLAERATARQRALLNRALDSVLGALPSPQTLVLAGEGEFLAKQVTGQRLELAGAKRVSLGCDLGSAHSKAACAHAIAVLAAEGI